MVMTVVWAVIAAGIFAWNHFRGGEAFIGILGTDRLLGFPLDGGFLAAAISVYCLIRWRVRRRRAARANPPGGAS